MTCRVCPKPVPPHCEVYCSDECRTIGNRQDALLRKHGQLPPSTRDCRYCGAEFTSENGARYCEKHRGSTYRNAVRLGKCIDTSTYFYPLEVCYTALLRAIVRGESHIEAFNRARGLC